MGTAYVTEYRNLEQDGRGVTVPIASEPCETTQKITTSGTSAQSAAFGGDVRYVRIYVSTDSHVLFGSNPTATNAHEFLAAGSESWRGVRAGQKLALIETS